MAKIAVTGAVIGTGSIGMAAAAQAATDAEWDTVARCESSGNWAINTGNGYQGGLQFSPSTWMSYGGGQFASAAHLASRDQQIAIGEKVLAGQGRGAWPVCGRALSGPTPRNVLNQTAPLPASPAADAPQPAAAPEPADIPAELPAIADELPAVPAPDAPPADIPDVETIAVGEDAPLAPELASEPPVETVPAIQTVTLEDQNLDVGGQLSDGNAATDGPNIIQASNAETLPQDLPVSTDPVDVPLPPAPVAIEIPAADAPAADAVPASTTLPAGTETTTVAASQIPVQHLPSPSSPPPGTSDEPVGPATNANVSYLKELWHAVQNQEIDRNDLMLALASRSLNTPVQSSAAPGPAAVDTVPVEAAAPDVAAAN